jgi:hypothetical protein
VGVTDVIDYDPTAMPRRHQGKNASFGQVRSGRARTNTGRNAPLSHREVANGEAAVHGVSSWARLDQEDQVHVERSRIRLLTGGAALLVTLTVGARSRARPESLPGITIYKSPT